MTDITKNYHTGNKNVDSLFGGWKLPVNSNGEILYNISSSISSNTYKNAIKASLDRYEEATGIKFVEDNSGGSVLTFNSESLTGLKGKTRLYDTSGDLIYKDNGTELVNIDTGPEAYELGKATVNIDFAKSSFNEGKEGRSVILHELTHAFGLGHPNSQYVGNKPLYSGLNTNVSIMQKEPWTGDLYGDTLLINDVEALAALGYGKNITNLIGDTKYEFGKFLGEDTLSSATYDGVKITETVNGVETTKVIHGNVFNFNDNGGSNTFDTSSDTSGSKIDMRAGNISNVGSIADSSVSMSAFSFDNVNAGSGADVIVGNTNNNIIDAGAGNDVIDGGNGTGDVYKFSDGDGVDVVSDSDGGKININDNDLTNGVIDLKKDSNGDPITDSNGNGTLELTVGNDTYTVGITEAGVDENGEFTGQLEIQYGNGDGVIVGDYQEDKYNISIDKAAMEALLQDKIASTGTDIDDYIKEAADALESMGSLTRMDPLVIDYDNDGQIELINVDDSNVFFDLDDDGFNEKSGWVAPDDALLVFDRNDNGTIDGINELFGNDTLGGFDELALLDTDNNGQIDANDADWSKLEIWQDANSDGITDAGELTDLTTAGVNRIFLSSTEQAIEIEGNLITDTGNIQFTDGYRTLADVDFRLNQVDSIAQADGSATPLTLQALFSPLSRGYGDLPSLQTAISANTVLAAQVAELNSLAIEDFELATTMTEHILYEWAGTTSIEPTSRGPLIDARKIETIEAFMGQEFPNELAGIAEITFITKQDTFRVANIWDNIVRPIQDRLLVQGPMAEFFPDASYDFATDKLTIGTDVNVIIGNALNVPIDESVDNTDFWFKFMDIVLFTNRNLENTGFVSDYIFTSGSADIEITTEIKALFQAKLGIDLGDVDIMRQGNASDELFEKDTLFFPDFFNKEFYIGGGGDDTLYGGDDNDILFGGDDNDVIDGGYGDDKLFGGDGIDVIVASNGNDIAYGNGGNDIIYAGAAFYSTPDTHTIIGGAGADQILVSNSNAVIRWGMGDGNDTIGAQQNYYNENNTDILEITDSITKDDLRINISGAKNINITNIITDDVLTITQYQSEVDQIKFDDGFIYNVNQGLEIKGNDSLDDVVKGWKGNDTIFSGGGNDTIYGNGGTDLFIHNQGDGNDTLYVGSSLDFNSTVIMNDAYGTALSIDDLAFNKIGYGLKVTDISSGEFLILENQFYQNTSGSDFSNVNGIDITAGLAVKAGSVDIAEVLTGYNANDTITGSNGNDTIYGNGGNDTISGGAGNDTIYGGTGTETFIHNQGDGNDNIYSNSAYDHYNNDLSTVILNDTAGIAIGVDNIYFNKSGNDLKVTNILSDETITIKSQFYRTDSGYEVNFVNGIDVTGGLTIKGTSATAGEILHGTAAQLLNNDTLIGGAGNDTIYGNGGSDTFIHNQGDGDDQLHNTSIDYGNNNLSTVIMNDINGVALTANDITFNRVGNDLKVTNILSGEILTLQDQFYKTTSGYDFSNVNGIDVAGGLNINGTSAAEILSGGESGDVILGNAGNDTIYGYGGNDTIYGYGGNDNIYGGTGTETFIHNQGDGNDNIYSNNAYDYYNNDLSTVILNDAAGIAIGVDDIYFNKSGNDLKVTNILSGEILTLQDQFYRTTSGYEFTTVNGIDVTGGLTIRGTSATAGENLYGTAGSDTIIGGAGNDYIYGGTGTEIFIHNQGDGNDYIYSNNAYDYYNNDLSTLSLNDASGIALAADDIYFNKSGNDLKATNILSGETVTVELQFYQTASGYEVNFINGIDVTGGLTIRGTSATAGETLYATTNNDTLIGGAGADTLYSYGGNDVFKFEDVADSTALSRDYLADFVQGTDIIDFSAIATINDITDLTTINSGGYTYLDDNNSDFSIKIVSTITLGASDFVFV